MEQFYTRQKANDGVKLPLFNLDGTRSEHWILCRGVDSDEYRKAESAAKRKAIDIASIDDDDERAQAVRDTELEAISALVADWSFEKKMH